MRAAGAAMAGSLVARTIADLQWSDPIRPAHLAEVIQYRDALGLQGGVNL